MEIKTDTGETTCIILILGGVITSPGGLESTGEACIVRYPSHEAEQWTWTFNMRRDRADGRTEQYFHLSLICRTGGKA